MTPPWAARLASLIPDAVGDTLVLQLEAHKARRKPGKVTVELDCGPDGACTGGQVLIRIKGQLVTAGT